jgi:hypothetical protein
VLRVILILLVVVNNLSIDGKVRVLRRQRVEGAKVDRILNKV